MNLDLENTRRELIALRVKHGPIDLIQQQMAELQALLAAQ